MNKSEFSTLVDEVLKLKLDVAGEFIEEVIEEIADIGSPEKLIGKKYEDWTPQDLQRLGGVYGHGNDTPLAKLIFSKSYQELQDLESEV